jgi:hypothetical protein
LTVRRHPLVGSSGVNTFANTAGGVLLVGAHEDPPGAHEDPPGTLKTYVPMSSSDAHAVGDALRDAAPMTRSARVNWAQHSSLTP